VVQVTVFRIFWGVSGAEFLPRSVSKLPLFMGDLECQTAIGVVTAISQGTSLSAAALLPAIEGLVRLSKEITRSGNRPSASDKQDQRFRYSLDS